MKWFVSAKEHAELQEAYETSQRLVNTQQQLIQLLTQKIVALEAFKPKTGDLGRGTATSYDAQANVIGRGGWRAKAQAASEATMPTPPDSVKALEKRVAEQGGKTE